MSFDLDLSTNADEISEILETTARKLARVSEVVAKNKAMAKARTAIRKDIAQRTGLKSATIGRRLGLKKSTSKNRAAYLRVGVYPISALRAGAKQLKKGVSYKGPNGRVKNPNAFIGKINYGMTVFDRPESGGLDSVTLDVITHARRGVKSYVGSGKLYQDFRTIYVREFQFRVGREISKRNTRR